LVGKFRKCNKINIYAYKARKAYKFTIHLAIFMEFFKDITVLFTIFTTIIGFKGPNFDFHTCRNSSTCFHTYSVHEKKRPLKTYSQIRIPGQRF